mmetsp:Transcript_6107/g.11553  ORF Transcript_6107/g.11553 Transcript_6107/m.11553 type:complete len:229 (-) Transcript_6107:759-1445(-)
MPKTRSNVNCLGIAVLLLLLLLLLSVTGAEGGESKRESSSSSKVITLLSFSFFSRALSGRTRQKTRMFPAISIILFSSCLLLAFSFARLSDKLLMCSCCCAVASVIDATVCRISSSIADRASPTSSLRAAVSIAAVAVAEAAEALEWKWRRVLARFEDEDEDEDERAESLAAAADATEDPLVLSLAVSRSILLSNSNTLACFVARKLTRDSFPELFSVTPCWSICACS